MTQKEIKTETEHDLRERLKEVDEEYQDALEELSDAQCHTQTFMYFFGFLAFVVFIGFLSDCTKEVFTEHLQYECLRKCTNGTVRFDSNSRVCSCDNSVSPNHP